MGNITGAAPKRSDLPGHAVDPEHHVERAQETAPEHDVDRAMRDPGPAPAPTSPVLDFTHLLLQHGPSARYLPRILVYYVKLLFFEPFRWLENLLVRRRPDGLRLREDPVFILGYYRSGTTHLQEVLLQDPRFGYLNFYQCYFQKGFLVTERFFKKTFGRIMTAIRFRHPAHGVPFEFDLPGEEDVSLTASGFGNAACWGQLFPRSFRAFFSKFVLFEGCSEEERAIFERELQDLIGRVSVAHGGKRLLLKSPPHTARVAMLRRLYPGAKFIFIRRNPYLMYKSNQKLWRSFYGQCLQSFDDEQAREGILWSFDRILDRYEREKRLLAPGQLVEVAYEKFAADPLGVLRSIYQELGLGSFDDVQPRFQEYLARKHGTNVDRYRIDERDVRDVEAHWKRWLDAWGYSRPPELTRIP
jgi:omega-hydroxy-beta-dihydromenaquinone-9 sulfotransferase